MSAIFNSNQIECRTFQKRMCSSWVHDAKNIVPILPKTKSHPISPRLSLNIYGECEFL